MVAEGSMEGDEIAGEIEVVVVGVEELKPVV